MPQFGVLGPLTATTEGVPLPMRGPVQRKLLAVLLAFPNQAVSHDRLVEALWPERVPQEPPAAMQTLVSRVRRLVGEDVITTQPKGYLLRTDAGELDSLRFEQLASRAREARASNPQHALDLFTEAAELWQGSAFEGIGDPVLLQPVVARLETSRLTSIEDRAELLVTLGRGDEATTILESLVESHPVRERPLTLLMRAHYACGRQAEALSVAATFRRYLAEELGLDPSPAISRLEERILRHEMDASEAPRATSLRPPPRQPAAPGPLRTMPRRRAGLYGRDEDVRTVEDLIDGGRLVTVVGVGGVGKTSLSLVVADNACSRYADGVMFCELAKASDTDGVLLAVADAATRTFGTQSTSRDFLLHDLASRRLFLVLDNCEHVLDAVARLVDDLFDLSATVAVLATSRERIRIDDEVVWRLAPLNVESSERGGLSDSARLFIDRAVAGGAEIDVADHAAIEQVCRRLDGLPLAIELAAARASGLTLREIHDGLTDRFALLGLGRRVAERRHQSLTSVVEWSYALLTPADKLVFDRLSVFPADFDLRGACEVATTAADDSGVVESVLHLVECSLLQRRHEGPQSRYYLLDTIREYGLRNLGSKNLADDAATSHADSYLKLVEQAEIERSAMRDWFSIIDREIDNLRAARKHYDKIGDDASLLKLSSMLYHYGWHSLRPEVFHWAADAVGRNGVGRTEDLGAALATVALGAWLVGDLSRAELLATEGVQLCSQWASPRVWFGLDILGDVAVRKGQLDVAAGIYQRDGTFSDMAIEEYQAAIHSGCWAITLATTGRVDAARDVLLNTKPLIDRAQSLDVHTMRALAECEIARHSADLAGARSWSARAAQLADESRSAYLVTAVWTAAATVETDAGCIQDSARMYQALIGRWPAMGAEVPLALTLRGIQKVLVTAGRHVEAATLYGAMLPTENSAALPDVADEFPLITSLVADPEHPVASSRTSLGENAFLQAVRQGRELPHRNLIHQVKEWLAELAG